MRTEATWVDSMDWRFGLLLTMDKVDKSWKMSIFFGPYRISIWSRYWV